MADFTAWDTLHGREGSVYITIDGNQEKLGNVILAKVDEEREIEDVPIMGIRNMQHKPGGKNITGELTLYYSHSSLRDKLLSESDIMRPSKIDLVITNNDPASNMGVQSIIIHDLFFESFTVAQVDAETELLKEDLSFSAGGYKVIKGFERN